MQGREGLGRVEARGQFADKGFHGGVPQAVEAKEIHFFDGFLGSPFIGGDAISGDENAGAIVAKRQCTKIFWPGLSRRSERNWTVVRRWEETSH